MLPSDCRSSIVRRHTGTGERVRGCEITTRKLKLLSANAPTFRGRPWRSNQIPTYIKSQRRHGANKSLSKSPERLRRARHAPKPLLQGVVGVFVVVGPAHAQEERRVLQGDQNGATIPHHRPRCRWRRVSARLRQLQRQVPAQIRN